MKHMTDPGWNAVPEGSADDSPTSADRARNEDAVEASDRDRRDSVVIDQETRPAGALPGLSAARVEQIQRRIAEDAYRSDAVIDLIARRMIAEGDIQI